MMQGATFIPSGNHARFIGQHMARIPRRLRNFAEDQHITIKREKGRAFADYWLENYSAKVQAEKADELNTQATREQAQACAVECMRAEIRGDVWEVVATGAKLAKDNGIPTKTLIKYGEVGAAARFTSSDWWFAALVRAEKRAIEAQAIKAGKVHKGGQIYATDATVEDRREQLKQGREFMARMNLESENGDLIGMSEAAAAGVSNPVVRHAELMTRINGFEQVAKKRGHIGIFLTATAPSKYHTHSQIEKNKARKARKEKEITYTPKVTQEYLAKVWTRCRAQLDRAGLRPYGLRVVEPHHDGTPHWHLILFMQEKDIKRFYKRFARHFRAEDRHELKSKAAKKARVDAKIIDPKKGSAAAYVAKYIAKNISGEGIGQDHEGGGDCATTSERVHAWASVWGVRQFQQIGGHYVSTWREARRAREIAREQLPPEAIAAWEAAQRVGDRFADWAAFIEALGGIETSARDAAVRVAAEFEEADGIYGFTRRRRVLGLRHRFGILSSNRLQWVLKAKG